GRMQGAVVNDVGIRGFTLEGGPGGSNDIALYRAQNFSVRNNVVTTGAEGIGPVASSGVIVGNYIAGVTCGACIRGGYPDSPASIDFTGNRAVHNRSIGLLLGGGSYGVPDYGDRLDAIVTGNDLSENAAIGAVGLRIFILRKDPPDTQSTGN